MVRKFACIYLLSFIFFSGFAQKFVGFSQDLKKYPEDLRFVAGKTSDAETELLDFFALEWKNNAYDSIQKKQLVDLSILMYDHKARWPQLKQLIVLFRTLNKAKINNDNYLIWLSYITELVSSKKTWLTSTSVFMDEINNLVESNYLFYSQAAQWRYFGDSYVFKKNGNTFSVEFPYGTIKCYFRQDSIDISKTSGVYIPLEHKWIGKDGVVTWERAGYSIADVNAKLNKYTIDLNKTEYKADSVVFTYGKYFSEPLLGKISDKVVHIGKPEAAIYPEFESYGKRFFLRDIYPNIDYDGGFTVRGAKIIGSGNATDKAKIIVKKDYLKDGKKISKTLMIVDSKFFVFRPERINGINTSVRIYLENDSIYHSDLSFAYYVAQQEVNLTRGESYSSQSPYYDSYHKLDMHFEQLSWRINQSKINLSMSRASTIGKAKFESQTFFNQLAFEALQGQDMVNPLVAIRRCSQEYGDVFPATAYINFLGRQPNEVKQVLMFIAQKGYIYYDSETDMVTIKDKLINSLKAIAGSIDYDVMSFNSTTEAPLENASLDMDNLDLTIHGISKIALSDSQNVAIYPAHDQIIMKQNRSFQFDGVVDAGLFKVYGNNFFFNYDAFKINLQSVDSVIVSVYSGETDQLGRPITKRVKNSIRRLTGELLIDKPDNKSGRKNYAQYPLFASRENSYVYYQDPSIEHNVYPEESFYFELYPFEIDSLDNFKKEGMNFRGKFQSSNIFPTIEQNLVLRPDYSLGFKYNPGPGGIPVYDGKGILYGDIDLSNRGLKAGGKLNYLTSTTLSKEFKFYPDSMNTMSDQFNIARQTEGTQFPKTDSKGNYIHWVTNIFNTMYIKQGKDKFNMFNDKTSLAGNLMLEPKGLSGTGKMNLTTADIKSKLFKYKAEIIDADTSMFLLKSLKKDGYTVLTEENVTSHIDFSTQKGEFSANEDYTKVDFPENKYISYLDYFKWNMDQKTLEMTSKRSGSASETKRTDKVEFEKRFRFEEETDGPRYISVLPKQDSVNFVAPTAIYDYQNNFINATDVKLLRLADAIVYTKDGKVTVAEDAQMKTLYGTKIVANYQDKLHTIYNADINVHSRINFTGRGKYDYVDEAERIQTLEMKEISVDKDIHTIAKTTILEPDSFKLSPFFGFQGNVTLNSSKPLLLFNGGAKILPDCETLHTQWLKFESELDPKSIYIPVSENPVSINNNKIFAGVFIASDSIHIYPAFLSGRRTYNDQLITTSSGFLHFNKDSMIYEIASKEKMLNRDTTGSYLSFHKTNCVEYGEGKLNLGVDLGQLKLTPYGSVTYNLVSKEVDVNLSLGADFMFDASALKLMAVKIDSFPNLQALDINRPLLKRGWYETIGRTKTEKYKEEITLLGKPKEFPVELKHTINMSNVHLKWNEVTKSYQSAGKIGVGNIDDYQVNRMVEGFIDITKRRSGDMMDIYFKLDDQNFYYYGYTRSVMQAYSGNNKFMEILRKLPVKVRQMDIKKGDVPYIYLICSDAKIATFLREYRRRQNATKLNEVPEEQPSTEPQPQLQQNTDTEPPKSNDKQDKKDDKPAEGEVQEVK